MALNPNHAFEDLGEVKCSIVEKNCSAGRTDFLKKLLEHNGFTVVVAKTPPPKAAPKVAPKPAAATADNSALVSQPPVEEPPPPDTFTVGVTDMMFNTMNVVYNRELIDLGGNVVTPAYWKQLDAASAPDEWYWKK